MMNQDIQLEITYYTDPLCCWSWGFEPQWRRLRMEYGKQISYRYRMAGMIQDWNSFSDPLNSVSKPAQMGPVWMEASHTTGMPVNNAIWIKNPPASSFPSCIAFKAAELQSVHAAEGYLRLLREAVMIKGYDISDYEILIAVAAEVASKIPEQFNLEKFKNDLQGQPAREAFKEDLQLTKMHNITRFPTLTISKPGENGVGITGFRPYEALLGAVKLICADVVCVEGKVEETQTDLGSLTEREKAELAG